MDINLEEMLNNHSLNSRTLKTIIEEEPNISSDDNIVINKNNIYNFMLDPSEENENKFVDMLNVFICYFKKFHNKQEKTNMFETIDYDNDDSTNKCMEFLYEEMSKFNNYKDQDQDKDVLFDPNTNEIDIKDVKELYMLMIDNKETLISKLLLPMIKYVSTIDWINTNWIIIPLK